MRLRGADAGRHPVVLESSDNARIFGVVFELGDSDAEPGLEVGGERGEFAVAQMIGGRDADAQGDGLTVAPWPPGAEQRRGLGGIAEVKPLFRPQAEIGGHAPRRLGAWRIVRTSHWLEKSGFSSASTRERMGGGKTDERGVEAVVPLPGVNSGVFVRKRHADNFQ